jgi:AsmA protein
VVAGIAGLLVLIALVLLLIVNSEAYKGQLESSASDASGMEISVEGQLKIDLFPRLQLTLERMHIRNRGTDVLVTREALIDIDVLSLIQRNVRINKVMLKSPVIFIERRQDGTFNVESARVAREKPGTFDLPHVSISDGTLRYSDTLSGMNVEAVECDSEILVREPSQQSDSVGRLSFTGELACGEVRANDLIVSNLRLTADRRGGVLDIEPITMRMFGAEASGSISADFTGTVPAYQIDYSLPQFRMEEFLAALMPQGKAKGMMDFSASLSMRGTTALEMKQTMAGQVFLRGENLTFEGVDLDETLSRFESSQNFNLVDVGAFFVAGPIGLIATKGYNFANMFSESGTSSEVRILVSNWKVEEGVAQAADVAMATNENRIALQGGLDLANEQFEHMVVALIDEEGCTKVRQKIHGSFYEPMVDQPNVFKTLAGPAVSLFKQGQALFLDGECEVFYTGSVAAPL